MDLVDASGNPVASYAYDTWGNLTSASENFGSGVTWSNPYRYDGRDGVRYDAADGFYWMRVRAYDPTIGRFISSDPLGRAPLFFADQPYAYAENNPRSNVDPSGQRYMMASGSGPVKTNLKPASPTRVAATTGTGAHPRVTWDSLSWHLLGEFAKDEGVAAGALATAAAVCAASDGAACSWVGLPALSVALQYAHDALIVLDKLVRHVSSNISLGNPIIMAMRLNRILIDIAEVVIALSGFTGLLSTLIKNGADLVAAVMENPKQDFVTVKVSIQTIWAIIGLLFDGGESGIIGRITKIGAYINSVRNALKFWSDDFGALLQSVEAYPTYLKNGW